MQVIEQQRDRALATKVLDQRAQRPVIAEALRRNRPDRHRRTVIGGGGQDTPQLGSDGRDPGRMQCRHMVVERVDGHAERTLAFMLDAAALQHEHSRPSGALGDRRQQRALADPDLTQHAQHPAATRSNLLDRPSHRHKLAITANQFHRPDRRPTGTAYSQIGRSSGRLSSTTDHRVASLAATPTTAKGGRPMHHITRSLPRRFFVAVAVTLAALLALALTTAVKNANSATTTTAAVTAAPTNKVFAGFHDEPISMSDGGLGAIATLNVAAKGSYVINAKLDALNQSSTGSALDTCILRAGSDIDTVNFDVDGGSFDDQEAVALQLVHTFPFSGTVTLVCTDHGSGHVVAEFTKITAVEVATPPINGKI